MDEVLTEEKKWEDPRPKCVHCLAENREVPKIGILYVDLDGKGRRPSCGEHYDIARDNGKNAIRAMIQERSA